MDAESRSDVGLATRIARVNAADILASQGIQGSVPNVESLAAWRPVPSVRWRRHEAELKRIAMRGTASSKFGKCVLHAVTLSQLRRGFARWHGVVMAFRREFAKSRARRERRRLSAHLDVSRARFLGMMLGNTERRISRRRLTRAWRRWRLGGVNVALEASEGIRALRQSMSPAASLRPQQLGLPPATCPLPTRSEGSPLPWHRRARGGGGGGGGDGDGGDGGDDAGHHARSPRTPSPASRLSDVRRRMRRRG